MKITIRTYTWKGEDWAAIYFGKRRVQVAMDRLDALSIAHKLGAEIHFGTEARNPAYWQRPVSNPPPIQPPAPGVIRHPDLGEDGTWGINPSRLAISIPDD